MKKVILSSDSTCDLPESIIAEYGIKICPIAILLGNDLKHDTVDVTAGDVLDFVKRTGTLPKTSATSAAEYKEWFENLVKDGGEVIHFCISSKSSSCVEHAREAASEVGNVYVVDSFCLSSAQGIEIVRAAELLKEGKTAEEVYEEISSTVGKVQLSFVVDTLEFLHKGGRCSSTALLASKMLKIHPVISTNDGALCVKKKYMGNMKRVLTQYVSDLAAEYKNYDPRLCFITHSPADAELVETVRSLVNEKFAFERVEETFAGSTVTSHCGYNTIGVIFYNK